MRWGAIVADDCAFASGVGRAEGRGRAQKVRAPAVRAYAVLTPAAGARALPMADSGPISRFLCPHPGCQRSFAELWCVAGGRHANPCRQLPTPAAAGARPQIKASRWAGAGAGSQCWRPWGGWVGGAACAGPPTRGRGTCRAATPPPSPRPPNPPLPGASKSTSARRPTSAGLEKSAATAASARGGKDGGGDGAEARPPSHAPSSLPILLFRLTHCPKCNAVLEAGRHHVGCAAGPVAPRQAAKRLRMVC